MILLTGPEDFEFARRSVGPSRPLEKLAQVSRAGELMAVVGMANETNRLVNGYRVPIDEAFEKADPGPAKLP